MCGPRSRLLTPRCSRQESLSVVSHVDETAFRDLELPKVWPPPARLRTVRYLLDILPTRELESLLSRTDVSVPIQSILLGYVADAIESK